MSPSPFLNRVGSNFALGREHIRKLIGFPKPASNRCLDFIAVLDLNDVIHLGLRCGVASSHLGSLQRATEENAEFEKIPLGTDEEVAGLAREHDRLVRSVNPLIDRRKRLSRAAAPKHPADRPRGSASEQLRWSSSSRDLHRPRPTACSDSTLDRAYLRIVLAIVEELALLCLPAAHAYYRQDLSTPCFRSAVTTW